jgi:hypothetical protein
MGVPLDDGAAATGWLLATGALSFLGADGAMELITFARAQGIIDGEWSDIVLSTPYRVWCME